MTCSSGTKRSPSGMTTKRGTLGGTFTRAKRRSPVTGSRTITARFSERWEMYGNGWPGSTASGRQHREDPLLEELVEVLEVVLVELVPPS